LTDTVLARIPQPYRDTAFRHRELVKFTMVGGTTWVIDTILFLALKSSLLAAKPVIAVVIATITSYVLNREWSFRTRGGRGRRQEVMLFFLISGIAVAVYSAPLYISRYVLELQEPYVSPFTQNVADFLAAQVIGVLLGMAFRWWGFRRFVFPQQDVRRQLPLESR
jgi:putative flippase GtrA